MGNDSIPPLERIVEMALYVDDIARSRAFYVDILGCEPLLESQRLLALSVGDVSVLLLFLRGATSEPLPTPGGVVAVGDLLVLPNASGTTSAPATASPLPTAGAARSPDQPPSILHRAAYSLVEHYSSR